MQTIFSEDKCIECDACIDICPTSCVPFITDGPEKDIRTRTKAPVLNITQPLYISGDLKTYRIMVKMKMYICIMTSAPSDTL